MTLWDLDKSYIKSEKSRKMECLEYVLKSADIPTAVRICQLGERL